MNVKSAALREHGVLLEEFNEHRAQWNLPEGTSAYFLYVEFSRRRIPLPEGNLGTLKSVPVISPLKLVACKTQSALGLRVRATVCCPDQHMVICHLTRLK